MFVVLLCFHTMLAGNSRTKQNIRLSQDWKNSTRAYSQSESGGSLQMRCIGTHSSNVTWYLGHSVPLQAQLRRGWNVTGAQQLLKIRYQQSVKGLRWLICLFFSNFFIWLDLLSLISKLFSEYPARYWYFVLIPVRTRSPLVILLKLWSCMQSPF